MILGGDFNCVFELTDRKSKIVHTDKSTNILLETLDNFYLNDTWKKIHNSKCGFTWCDSSNTPASRIDYIFVSQMILAKIQKIRYSKFQELIRMELV